MTNFATKKKMQLNLAAVGFQRFSKRRNRDTFTQQRSHQVEEETEQLQETL